MLNIIKSDKPGIANRLWFAAGLAAFLLIFFGLTKEIVNRRQISKQISGYKAEIVQLQLENSSLGGKIDNWDKSGELELNARVKLGLEKPGEQTIVINRALGTDGSAVVKSNQEVIRFAPNDNEADLQSNPVKWWNYFFSQAISPNK